MVHSWAAFEASDPDALAKFDLPIKVTPYYKDGKNQLWGMSIAFVKDGVTATTIGVKYDNEEVIRHEWVGRGSDGFPTLEGNSQDILGANLEIRCAAWGSWEALTRAGGGRLVSASQTRGQFSRRCPFCHHGSQVTA